MSLSKEEIDEELVNDDLIRTGSVENQDVLQQMNLEEKKNLLKGIKQSQEEFENAGSKSLNQSTLDTSASNFPSLPAPGKCNPRNKLKLPRKQPSVSNTAASDDSSDNCISLLDEKNPAKKKFRLPFSIDDGAPSLPKPKLPLKFFKNSFFVMEGESPANGLKRMLAHHDKWKDSYLAETSRMEQCALKEDIEGCDDKELKDLPKSDDGAEVKENDPYDFATDSPGCVSKVYNGPRQREMNLNSDSVLQPSSRQVQRKTSRDSDCEEVELVLKPEEPKMSEWTRARSRNKRNRKHMFNQEKGKMCETTTDVEFDFDNMWDAHTSTWHGGVSSSSNSNDHIQNRRSLPNTPEAKEEKVQCPICQRNYPLSKVEAHAATCEGYSGSGSPMDVEEES